MKRNQSNKGIIVVITLYLMCAGVLVSCLNEPEADPIATIETGDNRYLQGYPISFFLELNKGSQADDYTFAWDFGDSLTATGAALEHTYHAPGTYRITVYTSSNGDSAPISKTIVVLPSLELLSTHVLNIDSPSGLSFGHDRTTLWVVSDRPSGKVVEIDLQGNKLRTLSYRGEDLEGVAFDARDSTLWLVDENLGKLIHINLSSDVLSIQNINGISDGSGLEGISLDLVNSRIYLLKEKDFGALITLEQLSMSQTLQQLSFAPDYSGMSYIPSQDKLWIISDEASSLYLVNLNGEFLDHYGFDLVQPEGLVYDETNQKFYIVDDTTDKLHVFGFWD